MFLNIVDEQAKMESLIAKMKHVNMLFSLLNDFEDSTIVNVQFLNNIVNHGTNNFLFKPSIFY